MNLGCLWSATTTDQLPPSPETLPPLFFCVGHHPTTPHPTCYHHPRVRAPYSVPGFSAHLHLFNPTRPRIPQSRPGPAQPCPAAALLPCPAPAFRPPSPPPLTDRPEKSHHLVSPFRASKNPAHCHPSILFGCRPFFPFSFLPVCSALVSSLPPFSPVCFWPAHSSICGRQKHPVASHPVGLKHPDSGASCSPDLRTSPLSAAAHAHTYTTTTIPKQHLTSSWLLSPA